MGARVVVLGRGVWCSRNYTAVHWSRLHIVSDKDADKRAVRALPITLLLTRRERESYPKRPTAACLRAACTGPPRAATMLLPTRTLLLLAALCCSLDPTGAEVSGRGMDSVVRSVKVDLRRNISPSRSRYFIKLMSTESLSLSRYFIKLMSATFKHSAVEGDLTPFFPCI